MSANLDLIFESLFFGAGAWLGFFIFLVIIVGLTLKWKETAVVTVPFGILIGLEYLAEGLGWQFLGMMLITGFILLYVIKEWG